MDENERVMRGAFSLLDLIPAGKYLSGLSKTGKIVGLTVIKTSIKNAVAEKMTPEQLQTTYLNVRLTY